jgi:N-acetylmuramoyl-L-alanine amidase
MIIKNYIELNKYSRPGKKLHDVKAIVVHWVAMPGATPVGVRSYFDGLKNQKAGKSKYRYASTQFTVDKDMIIQNMPKNEVAYHVGASKYTNFAQFLFGHKYTDNKPLTPNYLSIGIETCHLDWDGNYHKDTLVNLRGLCADLCHEYELNPIDHLIRHYDVTGKICPKYFVNHTDEWGLFVEDVMAEMINKYGGR